MLGCQELNYLLLLCLLLGVSIYIYQNKNKKEADTIESDLIKKAYFDPLTALPNLENINIILDDQIYRCQRREKSFFTALIKINDSRDSVMIESGQRLFNSIRTEDTVGYINTGIFIIVFNEYLDEPNLKIIIDRINKSFEEKFSPSSTQSFKIGIDMYMNSYPDRKTVKELRGIYSDAKI